MANVGGEEYGPFTWDQMLEMAAQGRVTAELPVRKTSDSQWSTAAAIPGLLGGAKPAANGKPAPQAAATSTAASKSAVKKAKPLARPAAGRPAPPVVAPPQNIPTGSPVGAPVGVAVGPSPPASSPSGAFSFDLGTSPSGKYGSVKRSVLDDDDDVLTKKKSNTAVIVGAMGGAALLVIVLVGLTIYITMNRGGEDEKLVATNTSDVKRTPKVEPGESNPGDVNPEGEVDTGAKKPAPAATKTTGKDAKDNPPGEATQVAALKGIQKWSNAAVLVSLKVGNAKISFSRIWMATDASGQSTRRVESPTSAAAEDAKEAAPPTVTADAAGGKPKYVFVEVTVVNTAGAILKYKGWNVAKGKVPFIADDGDRILKLIPISETQGVARLTSADVPGGKAITDILVFEAPTESFEKLRLVLPQNVFYDNTKNPYSGIEITSDVLANEGGPPVVLPPPSGIAGEEPNDPLVNSRKVPTDPATPEGPAETTKPVTTVKPEPPPPKKPSLIDEINKSFEEQDTGKTMDEGKGAEPATKTPPTKSTEPAKKAEPAKKKAATAKGKKK